MANALPWRQRLYEGMQRMPGLKNSPAQGLWWFIIFASSYLSLERFIDGFCHWCTSFDGLEERQLWLNPCHRQSAHKNNLLRASEGHHQYPKPCWGHYWRGSEALRPPRPNCHRPGVAFHLKVLVIAMLFPWHQAEAINRLPSSDRWPN